MPLRVIQNLPVYTIAVASGKGGVGKSTLTILLAAALSKLGKKVGVLDADLYGPSLRHLLPEDRLPAKKEGRLFPGVSHGIKILSFAFFQNETTMRAPMANHILKLFLEETEWGELDFLLIDFPPGTGDVPVTLAQKVNLRGALMISTPQKIACLDVEKSIVMFKKMNIPILGLIENMSYFKTPDQILFGTGEVEKLAQSSGSPFLGKIPLDPSISLEADKGKLVHFSVPTVSELAMKISTKMLGIDPVEFLERINEYELRIRLKATPPFHIKADLIQKNCPCAQCVQNHHIHADVKIKNFERVGRYGLRFDFSSGCSYGIYDFDLLKRIGSC